MHRRTLILLGAAVGLVVTTLLAQKSSPPISVEDGKDHWLFEFSVNSGHRVTATEDVHAIDALCTVALHSVLLKAQPTGIMKNWVSPSVVVANVTVVRPIECSLLVVLEKRGTDWFVIHQYQLPAGAL